MQVVYAGNERHNHQFPIPVHSNTSRGDDLLMDLRPLSHVSCMSHQSMKEYVTPG